MISNYNRPQLTIANNIQQTLATVGNRFQALCVAPQYRLNRYGKDAIAAGVVFAAAGQTLPYHYLANGIETALPATDVVDQNGVRLFGENLEANLAAFVSGDNKIFLYSVAEPNVVRISGSAFKGDDLDAAFFGRDVAIGDIVYVNDNVSGLRKRKVLGFRGVDVDASYGSDDAATNGDAGNSEFNPVTNAPVNGDVAVTAAVDGDTLTVTNPGSFNALVRGSRLGTKYGEQFSLTVVTGGAPGTARINIRSATGLWSADNVLTSADPGTPQVETATVTGPATGSANVIVTVTGAGIAGSPLATNVAVTNGDSANTVAGKIRTALNGVAAITALYNVGGAGALITLTRKTSAANDGTLNIGIDGSTNVTGVPNAANSANTTAGVVPDPNLYILTSAELAGVGVEIETSGVNLLVGDFFQFNIYGTYTRLGNTQLVVSDAGSGYTGTKDTTYLVEVLEGTTGGAFTGASIRVTDTSGYDVSKTLTVTNDVDFNLGTHGLRMHFHYAGMAAQDGLRTGDTFFVIAKAAGASTTSFDKVVLDGPAVNTTLFTSLNTAIAATFALGYTGEILSNAAPDSSAWVAGNTAAGIVVDASLSLFVAARSDNHQWLPFTDGIGKLFPSFRSLVPPVAGEDVLVLSSDDEIIANLGEEDLDNDAAFAAFTMFSATQGRPIGFLRVAGLTAGDFAAALKKVEATDAYYSLGIITEDVAVMQVARNHAAAMSQKDVKNFRKVYVGTDSPGSYRVVQLAADDAPVTATISNYQGGNLLVTLVHGAADVDLTTLSLADGDRFVLPIAGTEYPILEVLSASELVLKSGPVAPVSPAVPVEIWRADTVASQTDFLNQRAASLGSEFCTHIWVEDGTRFINGVATRIPNRFVAAEAAGLRSALLPQQGLTRTEITSVTSCPQMYLKYSQTDLDKIAAGGNFIVTQNVAGGAVFIRHQLTTQTSKGSLYYEDNAGAVMHYIDFQTKDICEPYIGRRNALPSVASKLQNELVEMLRENTLSAVDDSNDIGPVIQGYRNVTVALHPTLKDRFVVGGIITIGLPLNNIDVVWSFETLS